VSGPARVLVEDLPQRHRDHRGGLGFIDRHDLDFILRALWVSVVSLRTKPIPRIDRSGRGRARSPAEPSLGPIVPNKPNLPRTGRKRRCRHWGQSRQTKPITRRCAGMGEGRQGRPGRRCWAEVCQTKPIPPDRREGQVPCGKRVTTNWTCKGPQENKANIRGQAGAMDLESATVCRSHPVPPGGAS
jgi:hypothetical protein